ncbi:MAG TPA: hypothetical protein VIF64_14545 [Pyrinomonadaceae bacterium]
MGNQNNIFYNEMSEQLKQTLDVLPFDQAITVIEHHITGMVSYEGDAELNEIVQALRTYRERRLGEIIPGYNALKNN